MADSYYQGDYIKHPVLYELSHKYGFPDNFPESSLPNRLEEIKEVIRREIRKELKIKEGAEKLREVATDRRSLSDVASIVKKSNNKIAELKSELSELESQILLTQGNSNGQDIPQSHLQPSTGLDAITPNDKLLTSLEKQLSIETKVKNGAENMIETIGHHGRDKKLLVEAQQMLADSKAKIEFLRLRILKVRQNRQLKQASEENGDGKQRMETTLEERVEELLHRLRIEAAVVAGAKNVIRILQNNKVPDKKQLQADKHDSFHSTGVPPSDSGVSTTTSNSRKQSPFNSTCRSTCSIVLSACTDLFPTTLEEGQKDPFTYNTTASYTIVPEQPPRFDDPSDIIKSGNFLSVKDAYSQTSDNESKLKSEKLPSNVYDNRKRRPYDYRRTTDSMLSPPSEEAKKHSPSRHSSRSPRISPSNTLSPSSSRGNKKSPRTVHIDVYCTGSDAEDSTDSGSSYNHANIIEEESNSTPQTVYDSDQMRLHHRIADKNELPRRLANQLYEKPRERSPNQLRLLSKSNSKDEISESKQLLFNKHIGDQTMKQTRTVANNRNRFSYRRDHSDDCLSSNYPNSSRSTMRDMTCSSISSGVLASTNTVNEYLESSSLRETDCDTSNRESLRNSQSETNDQMKRKEIDEIWAQSRKWRSPEVERRFLMQQKKMLEYMHQNERFIEEKRGYTKNESVKVVPGKGSGPTSVPFSNVTVQQPRRICCGKVIEEPQPQSKDQGTVHKLVLSPVRLTETQPPPEKHKRVLFTPSYSPSSQTSSTILDQANDHWSRARKFGAVVGAMRKTGHHFGPAKNPDCQCEHCRRWVAERDQFRSRTLSVGDVPYNRSLFWLKRNCIITHYIQPLKRDTK